MPSKFESKPASMSVPLEDYENSIKSKKGQKQKCRKAMKHSWGQAWMRGGDVTEITLQPYLLVNY